MCSPVEKRKIKQVNNSANKQTSEEARVNFLPTYPLAYVMLKGSILAQQMIFCGGFERTFQLKHKDTHPLDQHVECGILNVVKINWQPLQYLCLGIGANCDTAVCVHMLD